MNGEDVMISSTECELRKENLNLIARCEKAERASAKRQDGIRELDVLLVGYQIESERSLKEIESLKSKQKKLTDFLSKIYGRTWESDLSLQMNSPLPSTPLSLSSPAYRHKLGARPSFLETPISANYNSLKLASPAYSGEREELHTTPRSVGLEEEELRVQLEMVKALIKGYDERTRRRELELNEMELRAIEGLEIGMTELRQHIDLIGAVEETCA